MLTETEQFNRRIISRSLLNIFYIRSSVKFSQSFRAQNLVFNIPKDFLASFVKRSDSAAGYSRTWTNGEKQACPGQGCDKYKHRNVHANSEPLL